MKNAAIIISASSDIGNALSSRWIANHWDVCGTYRTESAETKALAGKGVKLARCDLSKTGSIRDACSRLRALCPQWDVLVMCPGMMQPIGAFTECDFNEWEESVKVNFCSQLRIIQQLLPARRKQSALEPVVILFAGGGTNNAPQNYSAYTVSKIALIKLTELLDAEIPDTRFVIIGPGWVKTKIHQATLNAGVRAGDSFKLTIEKLAGNECTTIESVLDCCDWVVKTPRKVVSGRNFSVVFDKWGTDELMDKLASDPDMYKLRRNGNAWR